MEEDSEAVEVVVDGEYLEEAVVVGEDLIKDLQKGLCSCVTLPTPAKRTWW